MLDETNLQNYNYQKTLNGAVLRQNYQLKLDLVVF